MTTAIRILRERQLELLVLALVGLASLVPTLYGGVYHIQLSTQIAIFALAAVGLNIAFGFSGQLTVAQAAFMAIGAYVSGVLTLKQEWPFIASFLTAAVSCAAIGAALGLITFRVRTHYLLLVTLGFHIIVLLVIVNEREITGGAAGLFPIPEASLLGKSFGKPADFYYLTIAMTALGVYLAERIRASRVGLAMQGLRQNETAARALGVNVSYYKVVAMGLSGCYGGIAGALFAHSIGFLGPESFSLGLAVTLVVIVMVGGMGSVWGTLVAAVGLLLFQERVRSYSDISVMVYGALVMLVMAVAPRGLAGAFSDLAARARRWAAGHGTAGQDQSRVVGTDNELEL